LGKYRSIQTYEQQRKIENGLRGYTLANSKSMQKIRGHRNRQPRQAQKAASSIFAPKIKDIWEEKSEDLQGMMNM
jgi:hypothetical protein